MIEYSQAYGISTYDAVFKAVLADDTIRPSFFHAFIPGITVVSSQRLDEHMNPLQELQILRNLLNGENTKQTVETLRKSYGFDVQGAEDPYVSDEKATDFLRALIDSYEDLARAFSQELY